jgi:adenylosuccinate synthase
VIGATIRDRGGEYGTTTGRPRRCGWFDAVATLYATRIVGPTHLAVMHLDTLSGMQELKVCVAYRNGPHLLNEFPADAYTLEEAQPVYETLPGWDADIGACRRTSDLPRNARAYLDFISRRLEVPVRIVGVGPARDQTVFVDNE